jgi:hypothetical protein
VQVHSRGCDQQLQLIVEFRLVKNLSTFTNFLNVLKSAQDFVRADQRMSSSQPCIVFGSEPCRLHPRRSYGHPIRPRHIPPRRLQMTGTPAGRATSFLGFQELAGERNEMAPAEPDVSARKWQVEETLPD